MLTHLARNWWVVALRGVLAILFGVMAFIWPGMTVAVLVLLFGAYALVDGVFAVIASFREHGGNQNRWALLLEGIAGIIAGVLTFIWPGITAIVLLYLIAAWAIVTGIFEIITAIRLRNEMTGEFWLVLAGILSVLFGVVIAIFPGAGALTVVWLIALYSIIFGVALIGLAFRLRGWASRPMPKPSPT
jgi:uncharacterized membrane protein HdeD (DUF308 family)